jgi:hypothetical protein
LVQGVSWLWLLGCGVLDSGLGAEQDDACEATADCGPGLVCTQSGTCQDAGEAGTGLPGDDCGHQDECAIEYVCASHGECDVAGEPGTAGTGFVCDTDDNCRVGWRCDDGQCWDYGLPYWAGVDCAPSDMDGPFRVLFEVPELPVDSAGEFYRLPFPNDARVVDGVLDLSGHPRPGDAVPGDPLGELLTAVQADFDGFALKGVVSLRFSRKVRLSTLVSSRGEDDTLHVAVLSQNNPGYGETQRVAWTARSTGGRYLCQNWLAVSGPGDVPWDPATTYAVFVTRGVLADDGQAISADPDFLALMSTSAPQDPRLSNAWSQYGPLRSYVVTQGLDADDIVAAVVFTTADPSQALATVDLAISSTDIDPDPRDLTLCDQGVISPCGDDDLRVCDSADPLFHEVHGRITLPRFQQGQPPYESAGGGWVWDAQGDPVAQGTEEVCFALTVPAGPPPAEGWPVVLVAHDVDGSFRTAVDHGWAAELADLDSGGLATLSLDLPLHGSRGSAGRASSELWVNPDNPTATVGSLLQGAADLHAAARWLADWELSSGVTGSAAWFDPDAFQLLGHGLGAEVGTLFLGTTDAVGSAVLANAPGDRAEQLLGQREPVDLSSRTRVALAEDSLDRLNPMLNLLRLFYDRSDPVSLARQVFKEPAGGVAPKHVFLLYGVGDRASPEGAQQALQLAMHVPTVGEVLVDFGQDLDELPASRNVPAQPSSVTAASVQLAPRDGHETLTEAGVLDQVTAFLETALTDEVPTVPAQETE